jgi:hypothetical protein
MLKTAGTVALALVLAAPTVALAAAPKKQATTTTTTKKKTTHTAAGMAAAVRATLARSDLGAGWTAGKPGPSDASPTCSTAGLGTGVVETGKAVSPTFSQGTAGPFVSQVVFVYATGPQATQAWQRTAGKTALGCLAQSVTSGSTKATHFTVLHKQTLAAPLGTRSAAYRVLAEAHSTAPAQTIDVYFDLILVGKGNALTLISYADFQQPLARSVEVSVARALARRL